jgi:hypothetical protein
MRNQSGVKRVHGLSQAAVIGTGVATASGARARPGSEQASVLAPLSVLVGSALLVLAQLYLAIPLAPVIGELFGSGGAGAAAALGTSYALAYGVEFLIFGPVRPLRPNFITMRKIEIFDPQQIGELRDAAFFSEPRGTRDELYTYSQHADDAAKLAVRRAQLWKAADDAEKDGDFRAYLRFAEAAATGNVQETKLRVKRINRTGNEKPRKHKLRNRVTAGIGTIVIALGVAGGITEAGHEQSHHYSSSVHL